MLALSQRSLVIPIDTSRLVGFVELIAVVDRKRKILEISDLNNSDSLRIEFLLATRVVGRHVFYNNSVLDRKTPGPATADDDAIDPSKSPMRPGQVPSVQNYTVYSRGLNGVMIDFEDFVGTPTLSHFQFHVGNDADVGKWLRAPNPISITLREGANREDPDRVTIIWADGAIRNQWLQVMVMPGAATGLSFADVFYFGNLVGDSTGDAEVNHLDFNVLRQNFGRSTDDLADGDYDADQKVGFGDYQLLGQLFGKKLSIFRAPVGAAVPASPVSPKRAPKPAVPKPAPSAAPTTAPTATAAPVSAAPVTAAAATAASAQVSEPARVATPLPSVPPRPLLKPRSAFSIRTIRSLFE
jgi:hypothetical protein